LRRRAFDFEPKSPGEHIKRKRLKLGLLRKQVAKQIRVTVESIVHWELGRHKPAIQHMPSIHRFLGYDSEPKKQVTLAERLIALRHRLGWSQWKAARAVRVDENT